MKFFHPHLLFWLWGLLPLLGIMAYGIVRHKKILFKFADPNLFGRILPGFSYGPKWVKAGLVLAGFSLCIFALAGPAAGFRWEKTTSKGVDIMIGLDCSRSMLAADVSPTRLERAKREIIDLSRLLHSDRAGLVAFSGQAMIQCPLTLDYQAFQIFLDVLGPDYLPGGGTDLTAALRTCYKGFEKESDTEKAIILITDGEDTAQGDQALMDEIQALAREKVRVFAIGVGDPSGAPVPEPGGGFKKDDHGNIILSRVDETTLKKITAMTQGRYVRSVAGDMDLELIYTQDILGTMTRKNMTQGRKKVWERRFQWLLLPGILLLVLELFWPEQKRSGLRSGFRSILGLALVLVLAGSMAFPLSARADFLSSKARQGSAAFEKKEFEKAKTFFIEAQLDNPRDLRLYYNIGTAAYALKDYELAKSNFLQAATSKDRDLRHRALYNLANTQYRLGNLPQAIDDYTTLVNEFADDQEARENLAFVKEKLAQEKERRNQSPKDQDPKDQDQKNQGQDNPDQKNQDSQKDHQDKDRNKDQNNKDQTDKASEQQNQNKDPGQDQQKENKDQTEQDQKRQGRDNQDRSGQKDRPQKNPPLPDPDQTPDPKENQAGATAAGEKENGDPGAQMLENRLNRLQDKPGMALIPQGKAQTTDKDW
ncbi:MAG: VWA domain-containing protein [Desulfobacter sp.]|nr:MAG: VWA domain-containing protein [Desulfobacter sp.]